MAFSPASMAQITGEWPQEEDSVIIFEPALPLLSSAIAKDYDHAIGLDVLFSGSGWGFGGFYHYKLFEDGTVFGNFGISGRRNTDEFENAWLGPVPVVSNKVNRLFMIPMTLGVAYRLFSGTLQESFRPFISLGVTPTIIIQAPYIQDAIYYEFFNSLGFAQTHFRWGGMFSIGANFGDPTEGSVMGVQMRYYLIPFGGGGLESVRGLPIENFGGVVLSLSIGTSI